MPGDRRTYFRPEEDLDQAWQGLLEATVLPRLREAGQQLPVNSVHQEDLADGEAIHQRIQNLVNFRQGERIPSPQ